MRPVKAGDFELVGCSTWQAPDGAVFLELPAYYIFPFIVPAGATLPTRQKATNPDYEFVLDVVSFYQLTGQGDIYGRFQWPNGHFSSQLPENLSRFYGLGQYGRLQYPPVVMPAGSIIRIAQLANPGLADSTGTIHFEGRIRIPLVGCNVVKPC